MTRRPFALLLAALTLTVMAPLTAADTPDAHLAAQITTTCGQHPGACRHTPTAADVATVFVPWICAWAGQAEAPSYGRAAWVPAWPAIRAAVLDAGRCADPSDIELAAWINSLEGPGPYPATAAEMPRVLGYACAELSAPMPTAYTRRVEALVAYSGRC